MAEINSGNIVFKTPKNEYVVIGIPLQKVELGDRFTAINKNFKIETLAVIAIIHSANFNEADLEKVVSENADITIGEIRDIVFNENDPIIEIHLEVF